MAPGIVATYLALAVWLSTQLRSRIGYRWWRRFHMVTFVVNLGSTLHGRITGGDSFASWAMSTYLGSFILVSLLVALRLSTPKTAAGHTERGKDRTRTVAARAGLRRAPANSLP